MTEKSILKIFKSEKALLSGHFLLSSGLHSPNYMQCALLLQKPWIAERLCRALAQKIKKGGARLTAPLPKIDVVIGPALGGVVVSYELGRALKVRAIFAERVEGAFVLRRGFSIKKGEKVLVVEDVVTTGKSTNEVIEVVRQNEGKVAGVASIVDRSDLLLPFQVPFYSLLKIHIKTYKPEECPLCKEGKTALTKPGSRGIK